MRPYSRNAKIHGTDHVAKIAASMAKFGWTVPCTVADDGELIAGHSRELAPTMLGLKDVPVIRLGHLDEAERRADRIADNKLIELGEWDESMLRDEVAGLLAEDFGLSLLGINDEDLDALLRDPDQVEGGAVEGEDDIPEPPVTPMSVAGFAPAPPWYLDAASVPGLSPCARLQVHQPVGFVAAFLRRSRRGRPGAVRSTDNLRALWRMR